MSSLLSKSLDDIVIDTSLFEEIDSFLSPASPNPPSKESPQDVFTIILPKEDPPALNFLEQPTPPLLLHPPSKTLPLAPPVKIPTLAPGEILMASWGDNGVPTTSIIQVEREKGNMETVEMEMVEDGEEFQEEDGGQGMSGHEDLPVDQPGEVLREGPPSKRRRGRPTTLETMAVKREEMLKKAKMQYSEDMVKLVKEEELTMEECCSRDCPNANFKK